MRARSLNIHLMLSIIFLGVSCQPSPASAEQSVDSYRKGLVHYKQGRNVEAVRAFRSAADEGHAAATGFLGWMYLEGKGVPKSHRIALGYFMDAAEKGDGPACLNVGTMYFNGVGVEQDYIQAVRWWKKGADLGEYRSADRLAHLLYSGDGVGGSSGKATSGTRLGTNTIYASQSCVGPLLSKTIRQRGPIGA